MKKAIILCALLLSSPALAQQQATPSSEQQVIADWQALAAANTSMNAAIGHLGQSLQALMKSDSEKIAALVKQLADEKAKNKAKDKPK